jgi:hypothetical protein
MKSFYKNSFLLFIAVAVIQNSCSENAPVLPLIPLADAGDDQLVEVFDTVYLSGALGKISEDAEYIWLFDYKPDSSNSVFSDSSSPNPFFIPDIEGFYNAQLVIRVGENYSESDYVLIQAVYQKSEQYFPNTIGSRWIYKTLNSRNIEDTLTFEIVGETILPDNKQATVWVSDINTPIYFYSSFDTLFLETFNDTLIFKTSWGWDYSWVAMMYLVPFTVGNTWDSTSCFYSVQEVSSLQTDLGIFDQAYKIEERRIGPNYYLTTYSWIVPYIGLVKRDIYEYNLGRRYDEHWELIWYHLNE